MATSPYDLTTVGNVKTYIGGFDGANHSDDDLLQSIISDFSQYVHTRTGHDLGSSGQGSCLNSQQSYTEIYNGNGSFRLFLRNTPIVTVSSLLINGATMNASTGYGTPGYFIEQTQRSLAFRSPAGAGYYQTPGFYLGLTGYFCEGVGNIQVVYTAGYSAVPFDLCNAVNKAVSIVYKRRDWIDQKSKALPQGGSTSYRDWALPPEVERVLINYTRAAVI